MVQRGTSTRSELSTVHEQHACVFEESLTVAMESMEAAQKAVESHDNNLFMYAV